MQRNFDQIDQAQVISAMDRSQQSMKLLAQALTQT
jgi:hypothetical protein